MQIVIDISDKIYEKVKEHYVNPYEVDEIGQAILDGTILPEHHGDLIDRQALIDYGIRKGFCNWYDEIKYAPTIIEEVKADDE